MDKAELIDGIESDNQNEAEWYEEKVIALAQFLECDAGDITETNEQQYDGQYIYMAMDEKYLVLTDNEADRVWDYELDEYIDQVVLPEIPEHLQRYFDDASWKEDAKDDGRGTVISSYDGNENEVEVNGEQYFIYRVG